MVVARRTRVTFREFNTEASAAATAGRRPRTPTDHRCPRLINPSIVELSLETPKTRGGSTSQPVIARRPPFTQHRTTDLPAHGKVRSPSGDTHTPPI